jgi:hypothetical protein
MKILFSPSESKHLQSPFAPISKSSFIFEELFDKRVFIAQMFFDYLQTANLNVLQNIYGIKDEKECEKLREINFLHVKTAKAIQRYSGVAYEYLAYETLDKSSQNFIDNNTLIFSNLFGPILAKDTIPFYKLKQGSSFNNFALEKFYKEEFSNTINSFLEDEFILDLRAGFYEKFYTLNQPYVSLKFIKNGKVVSHFAKAYRGIVLKELAKHKPNSLEEFDAISFKNLKIKEIQVRKFKKEYIFEIIDES